MANSTNTQLKRMDLRAERRHLPTSQTKNCYELELQFEKDSQNEIVPLPMQKGRATLTFDLAKGLVTVDRRLVSNMPKTSVRAVAAQSLTKRQPLIFSLTIRYLKSLSIKEKKYFLVGLPTCRSKWNLDQVWNPYWNLLRT